MHICMAVMLSIFIVAKVTRTQIHEKLNLKLSLDDTIPSDGYILGWQIREKPSELTFVVINIVTATQSGGVALCK